MKLTGLFILAFFMSLCSNAFDIEKEDVPRSTKADSTAAKVPKQIDTIFYERYYGQVFHYQNKPMPFAEINLKDSNDQVVAACYADNLGRFDIQMTTPVLEGVLEVIGDSTIKKVPSCTAKRIENKILMSRDVKKLYCRCSIAVISRPLKKLKNEKTTQPIIGGVNFISQSPPMNDYQLRP